MSALVGALPFRTAADAAAASPAVAAHLDAGGLIAYPTETVYGFGSAADAIGVGALEKLKGRSADKTFLLLVANQRMIDDLKLEWNIAARALAGEHWPGPLTLILNRARNATQLAPGLAGPNGGVAVRWTSHTAVARLLESYGRPITSTSANAPGANPAIRAEDVANQYREALQQRILILLDGGELPPSRPSTVIDCTNSVPRILRSGAIHPDELRATTPDLIVNE